MFGGFKPKVRSLPDLTPEMHHASDETIRWCLSQIGAFVDGRVRVCPEFGSLHDERIGSYAAGFLTGYLQVTGADRRWAKGDQGLMDFGVLTLSTSVLTAVMGHSRGVEVFNKIPFVRGSSASPDLHQIYRAGGGDGVAHATGEEKQLGGILLHYLEHNVSRPGIPGHTSASSTALFSQLMSEEFDLDGRIRGAHSRPATSTPTSRSEPLPNLADLGSRIEAAQAKHSKRT